MAESEEELKNLLTKVKKESEKAGLKLNIQKTKIMASSPITSWQIDGEPMEKVREFQKIFIDYAKYFDCVDHNKLENALKDGNTRPPDLPPEISVCRSRSNS